MHQEENKSSTADGLTQERLQQFSDSVADICDQMGLTPEEMLEAIANTLIGATLYCDKINYQYSVVGDVNVRLQIEQIS